MTKDKFRDFVDKQNWIFAKTYASYAPHEYALRKDTPDDAEFAEAAKCIIQYGIRMFYYKTERRYLFFRGYFYWIMESPEKAGLINRCKPEDYDIVFMKKGTQK